jgi:TonB family protein
MPIESEAPDYFGRYQVLEELGSGAMGVVYLCVDPRLNRPVAIKVMRRSEFMTPAEQEQYQARFRHEAEAAGRMNHPDIVQIYDVGPAYLVMEFLEGQPLSVILRAGSVFSVRKVCALVLRVADAIDYAHRHGIVHRDVKPANIMMMNDGGVKVMDFGVARLESSTLTAIGTMVGSVRYMSPEQMMGERVDGRADVFSLAAVAYELLTGSPPFPGKTITEVVARVVHGDHVPPRQADGRLPEAMNAVFVRAFATSPADRYSHALDFARALQGAAQPVLDLEVAYPAAETSPTRTGASAPTLKSARTATSPADIPGGNTIPHPAGMEAVLALDSDPPGAEVYVDGQGVGRAPLPGLGVAFGRHQVRMEARGRAGVNTEIEMTAARPLQALTCTLPPSFAGPGPVRPGQLVDFGPEVTPPRRIAGETPAYPEAARERGIEGSVVVDVWIGDTGDVIEAVLTESAGGALDAALLQAVAGWKFTPATLAGVPVSVRLTVRHVFRR